MIDRETLKKAAGAVGSGALIGSLVAGAATLADTAETGIGDAIQSNVNTATTVYAAVADRVSGGDAVILSGAASGTPVDAADDDEVNASSDEDDGAYQGCGVGTVTLE